jgi:hypothetical protein
MCIEVKRKRHHKHDGLTAQQQPVFHDLLPCPTDTLSAIYFTKDIHTHPHIIYENHTHPQVPFYTKRIAAQPGSKPALPSQ